MTTSPRGSSAQGPRSAESHPGDPRPLTVSGLVSGPGEVTATALGNWPGTDPVEAARISLGELGDPHLPHLIELPDRGVGSDAVGRTAGMLVELPVDVQPFGWRFVDRPGADHRRAVSALSTDINVLADVAGALDSSPAALKLQIVGPMSLAAALHLHYGERALLDHGARRDIADSLAAGLAAHVGKVAAAVPGAALTLQIDEPDAAPALAGTIPTASGYRTLRSIPKEELRQMWTMMVAAARSAGVGSVVFNLAGGHAEKDAWRTSLETALGSGADGVAVPLARLDTGHWEQLAEAVEAGQQLWASLVPVAGTADLPQVSRLVEQVTRPWHGVGLPPASLANVRITPADGLAAVTPEAARAILTRATDTARALNDVRNDS